MTVQQVSVRFLTTYSGQGTKQFQRDLNTLDGNVRKVSSTAGQSFTSFGRFAQAAGTALMVGVGAALAVGIKAAIDFEDAFAGVRKTLSASEGTFTALAEDIRELALDIPIAATELARIGALGAQLGIPANALVEFIDTVAKLGVATNLETDEAATKIARFVNVMGTSDEEISNVAASLVDLGNNFATTEEEILNFATRLTGIGSTIGLTEGDILGISAAMTALGEPAERGATAVQRAFQSMFTAVSEGGEDLELFAEVLGITADEFVTLFQEDPAQAFLQFAQGLDMIIDDGGNVITTLQDLGLGAQRTLAAMLKAAAGNEQLAEGLQRGNEAYKENLALEVEAEKRFGTMASQIGLLKNQFTDLRIEIGNGAAPAFKDVLSFAGGFFDVIRENMGALQGFALLVGVLAGTRGLVKLGVGLSRALIGLGNLGGGFAKASTAGQKLMDAMGGLAGGVRFMGGILGGAAIAIGLVGTAMAHNRQLANEYKEAIQNLTTAIEEYVAGTGNATSVAEAFGEVLAQKTGIFDLTADLEASTGLLHDLGISVNTFAVLATTDMEKFDKRMRAILSGQFGLGDRVIQDLFDEGFATSRVPLVGADQEDIPRLMQFLDLIRETKAATEALRREEELRRKERELELIQVTGEGPGDFGVEDIPGFGGEAISAGLLTTADEYQDALAGILADTQAFSSEFSDEWSETVADFNAQMFDWETALDGYEQVTALSTKKMKASLDNWVADQQRLSTAVSHVYGTFGREIGDFFRTLPEDVQRGMAATLAESGPDAFSDQLGLITDAWGQLEGFALDNLITFAPSGAQAALDAWTDYLNNDLLPTLEEHAPRGSQEWIDGVIAGFATFKDQLLLESPEVALAFDELMRASIAQMDKDIEVLDVAALIQNMTTAEKIKLFNGLGISWAEAVAMGFATLPQKVAGVASSAAAKIKAAGNAGLEVQSPSKVGIYWGEMLARGLAIGLEQNLPNPFFKQFTKVPQMLPQAPTPTVTHGPTINIVNPEHKEDDVLDGVKRAASLAGLVRNAEVTPGFN